MERFVPGRRVTLVGPLSSYRQPLPESVIATYIDQLCEPGGLVVTPFTQSDTLARVALAMGRRSVSAHSNPLLVLLARAEAAPASSQEVNTIFARVATAPRYALTTRQHLLDLYRSHCPHCRGMLSADYFVWDRKTRRPIAKGYQCPSCQSAGEAPVDEHDLKIAGDYETKGLAYWRALSRLSSRDEPTYARAQALLELYTGRNLYALLELTHRLEALAEAAPETPSQRDARLSILLECLDLGTSLDSPDRTRRMAKLGLPARFLERNMWRVFERACENARTRASRPVIPFSSQLDIVQHRTAIVLAGAGQLVRGLPPNSVELVMATPPTPSPAFWTLSFMWTAWLFGKEQASHLAHWLRRYGIDWNWYIEASRGALSVLARSLAPEGRIVFVWRCEQRPWLEALLVAAGFAGLEVAGLACQPCAVPAEAPPEVEYRLVLAPPKRRHVAAPQPAATVEELSRGIQHAGRVGAIGVLQRRGEPTPGPYVHAGAYRQLCEEGWLAARALLREQPSILSFLSAQIWSEALQEAGLTLWPPEQDEPAAPRPQHPGLEPDLWWMSQLGEVASPLTDRVEEFLVQFLVRSPGITARELGEAIYEQFTGLLTPTEETISACLISYAQQVAPDRWELRPEDMPARRQAEMEDMLAHLRALGERIGMTVCTAEGGHPASRFLRPTDLLWVAAGETPYLFRVVWDTATKHLDGPAGLNGLAPRRYLVLPGGRSSLVSFRMRACPLWAEKIRQYRWQFIKYRHIRRLLQEEFIDSNSLLAIAGLDPIVEQPQAQIPLF